MKDLPPSQPSRFAIVTGAAAGIGRATTELLVAAGWSVGAFDMDDPALRALAADLGRDRLLLRQLDITDEAAWIAAIDAFAAWSGGRLHLLVNNAGIIAIGPFAEVSPTRARRMLDVNIMGVVNGIHASLPLLGATSGARVINVSSIAALTGWPYSSVYSASKSALYNLTEALSAELGPRGIAVCDVLPSFIRTQLVADDRDAAEVQEMFRGFQIAFTSPGRVARYIVAAIDSSKIHHIVGRQAHVYAFITRYLPMLGRFMSRGFGRRYAKIIAARSKTAPRSASAGADSGAKRSQGEAAG